MAHHWPKEPSYLAQNSSLFGPDGAVNYDYIVTNNINSLLIGSKCITKEWINKNFMARMGLNLLKCVHVYNCLYSCVCHIHMYVLRTLHHSGGVGQLMDVINKRFIADQQD